MAPNIEWFREIFENIRVDVDRLKYLEELQIAMSAHTSSDLSSVVPNLPLNVVFDCVNTTDQ